MNVADDLQQKGMLQKRDVHQNTDNVKYERHCLFFHFFTVSIIFFEPLDVDLMGKEIV